MTSIAQERWPAVPEAGAAEVAVAEEERLGRVAIGRLGLWLFIGSESMLFFAMVAARFYLLGTTRPPSVNLGLGIALTLDLLVSSVLGYRALAALKRDDRSGFQRRLLGAIALGAAFLVGVAMEWSSARFGPGTAYGTVFFTTTGLHVAHLASGLVVLLLVWRLARRGAFSAHDYWGARAALTYWTFVDAMWVLLVFPALYLV